MLPVMALVKPDPFVVISPLIAKVKAAVKLIVELLNVRLLQKALAREMVIVCPGEMVTLSEAVGVPAGLQVAGVFQFPLAAET